MFSSYTGLVDTSKWWKCCNEKADGEKYNRKVNPKAWQDTCPECSHTKCSNCEDVGPPTNPAENTGYFEHAYGGHQHESYHRDVYGCGNELGYRYQYLGYTVPSFNGWWKCCQCEREVNGGLFGNDCPDCGHHRDYYCGQL